MFLAPGIHSTLILPLLVPGAAPSAPILPASPPPSESLAEPYGSRWLGGATLGELIPAPSRAPGFVLQEPAEPVEPADSGEFVDENAWYLRGGAGLLSTSTSGAPNSDDIDFDDSILVALAFGHHFGAQRERVGFDVELEALWNDQDTTGDIAGVRDYSALTLLLNALIEVRLVERLFFYGGGGIGTSFVDVGTQSNGVAEFDADSGPFLAWQLKAGFLWRFNHAWGVNLGYRFVNINNIEIQDSVGSQNFELGTEQNVIELGLTWSF